MKQVLKFEDTIYLILATQKMSKLNVFMRLSKN